jgi:hypothetical protein
MTTSASPLDRYTTARLVELVEACRDRISEIWDRPYAAQEIHALQEERALYLEALKERGDYPLVTDERGIPENILSAHLPREDALPAWDWRNTGSHDA